MEDLSDLIGVSDSLQEKKLYAEYLIKLFGERGKQYLMAQSSLHPDLYEFLTKERALEREEDFLWLSAYYNLVCWWTTVKRSKHKSTKTELPIRFYLILYLSKSTKRSLFEGCASDARISLNGASNITNTRRWLNQLNAITATARMSSAPIWEPVKLAPRTWRLVPNASLLRPKNRFRLTLTKGNKNVSRQKTKEKWINFWKLWKKDPEEQLNDFMKKIKFLGAPKKIISLMRKETFSPSTLGKDMMIKTQRTKKSKEVLKSYQMPRNLNNNS